MLTSLGTLTINNVSFPVTDATFTTDGRMLDLDVRGGHPAVAVEHDWWGRSPRLYAEAAPIPVDPDAPRSALEVESPADSADEWLFCLYVHEHEWVTRCRGAFSRDAEGHRFEATGEAEVMGEPVTFAVKTRIRLVAST